MADTQKAGAQAAEKTEAKAAGRTPAGPADTSTAPTEGAQALAGDASLVNTPARGDIVVTEGASAPFTTKPADVPVDPRSGQPFADASTDGLKGEHGTEILNAGVVVPGVDPDRIPVEVTPGVTPDAGGDRLFAAALAKAPNLTKEFVSKMGITEEMLAGIARGEIPPPPAIGPIYTTDLYLTPGGWQQTPPGVPPQDVGKNAVIR
ncbi:hypothetical protein AB0M54_24340 [Actinoplanes sp. NPDC051470]|uniref:hypothetical protein n=1 Tax=Actinoplanes sp. NPDC051470 TaxID=3157224 RepID=UPI00343AF0B7